MVGRDDDLALLKGLMEAGRFPAKSAVLSARGAATVALSLMCGVPKQGLVALRRAQWRPRGRDLVAMDPEGHYGGLRDSKARVVPLLGTSKAVVERYLALSGPGGPETALLQAETGGPCVANAVDLAFERAMARAGRPDLTLGRMRTLFVAMVEEADDRGDGTAEYLLGENRGARAPHGHTLADPPSEEAMRALLERAFPFHKPWRLLTHAGGGRGPKLGGTSARAGRAGGPA